MPRKVHPRWGQTTETNQADFEKRLNRVDQRLVLELLGVSDSHDKALHFHVVSIIMHKFYGAYFEPYIPANAEVRAAFDELRKSANDFEHNFFKLDWLSEENLIGQMERMIAAQSSERAAQDYQKFYDMLCSEPYTGRAMLSFLFEAIRTIKIKEYPARKGRPANYPVKIMIIHLSRYYEICTGKKAAKGVTPDPITGEFKTNFVRLIEHLLRSFDPKLSLSHEAIGEQIRSTIGDRSANQNEEIADAETVASKENVTISRIFVSELRPTDDGGVEEHTIFSSQVKIPRG